MRFDNLFQFIVPLTFLAIWALTSLLNREAQSLPPRTGRPPGPNGPRPGPPGSGPRSDLERSAESIAREILDRRPASGFGDRPSPSLSPSPARGGGRRDDGIVILESETRRPESSASMRSGGATSRRGARARDSSRAGQRVAEPSSPRRLAGALSPPFITTPIRPTEGLKPLERPTNLPLLSSMAVDPGAGDARARTPEEAAFTPEDVQKALHAPASLRASFLIGEVVFRPPLALRQNLLVLRRRG